MHITRKDLKNKAKEILRLRYWQIFIVALLFSVGINAVAMFSVGILVSIFVANPFLVAYSKFLKQCSESEEVSYSVLWSTVKENYRNLVKITFMRDLTITLWGMPAIVGVYMCFSSILFSPIGAEILQVLKMPELFTIPQEVVMNMAIVGGVITVAGLFLVIYKSYCYMMVNFIAGDNPEKDWRRVLEESKEMMDGQKLFAFLLELSFIGWYLLCSIITGLFVGIAGEYVIFLVMIANTLVEVYRDVTVTQLYMHLKGDSGISEEKEEFFESEN